MCTLAVVAHGEVQPQLSARNAGIFGASQLNPTPILHVSRQPGGNNSRSWGHSCEGGATRLPLPARAISNPAASPARSLFVCSALQTELPILDADVFEPGEYELPFEFPIEPIPGETLAETYHGVYVNVQYTVSVELKRSGMFVRSLAAQCPLVVHTPVSPGASARPVGWHAASVRRRRLLLLPLLLLGIVEIPPSTLSIRGDKWFGNALQNSAASAPLSSAPARTWPDSRHTPLPPSQTEAKPDPEPNDFEILPESLKNVRAERLSAIPPFRVTGRLEQTNASLTTPFVGHVRPQALARPGALLRSRFRAGQSVQNCSNCLAPKRSRSPRGPRASTSRLPPCRPRRLVLACTPQITVEESTERIRSLELQLVRVETVRNEGREARERTEIQNLQVGEGDVARGMPVPLYAVLPRLFTAPTVHRSLFSIEFEVNVIVRFERHYLSTLNIPITLYRG